MSAPHPNGQERMTSRDRAELATIIHQRAQLTRAAVDARKAELVAEFEAQLATIYKADDERWAAIVQQADAAVQAAKAQLTAIFDAAGTPEAFRPGLSLGWYGRGENAIAGRRVELRKAGYTSLEAQAKAAKLAVTSAEVELRADLIASTLDTQAGRDWLARIPTAEQLMPPLELHLLTDGLAAREVVS